MDIYSKKQEGGASYFAPEIQLTEVKAEQGFAATGGTSDDFNDTEYDGLN